MENVKVNITPLVDVCLSLLIVFLVSGALFMEPAIKVKPPEAATNEEKEEVEKIFVYITSDGRFAVDDEMVVIEKLPTKLKEKIKKIESKRVVIRADRDAMHGNLLKIMELAKKSGATRVTIATKKK
ncbi:ExbD/TolR family protein [bacterium]